MTREEAIEVFKTEHPYNPDRKDNDLHTLAKAFDMAISALKGRPKGEWKKCPDEGFVECPFCEYATNCDDNIDELHFCFFCGAELKKGGAE